MKENRIRPENMLNCDESGFQPNNGGGLLYMNRQNRHNYDMECDNTEEKFTVMFTCSATGSWLPPLCPLQGQVYVPVLDGRWPKGRWL